MNAARKLAAVGRVRSNIDVIRVSTSNGIKQQESRKACFKYPNLRLQGGVVNVLESVEGLKDVNKKFAAFASLLQVCADSKGLSDGRKIHAYLKARNYDKRTFLGNWLVKMYGDCGSLVEARAVFDGLPVANVYSWNILIKAYCINGLCRQALECFHEMQRRGISPSHVSFVAVLEACAGIASLEQTKLIHAIVRKAGYEKHIVVGTALLSLYGKCGSLEDAWNLFTQMPNRDVVTWSAMMAACVQNGRGSDALELYNRMKSSGSRPNQFTFVSALDACANLAALEEGQKIHDSLVRYGYDVQPIVGTALVQMYGKCRRPEDARRVFDQTSQRDIVCWGAIITAYAQNGHALEALDLFSQMQHDGFKPNHIIYASALDACATLAALEKGKELHAAIMIDGLAGEVGIGNALVDMYGKCGNLEEAKSVFDRMPSRNLISWNAMIGACANNGHSEEAFKLFNKMTSNGFAPDQVTFLGVLTACKHAGNVDEARRIVVSMREKYGIDQTMEHHMCLVDILGRAGSLHAVEDLTDIVPFKYEASCLQGL